MEENFLLLIQLLKEPLWTWPLKRFSRQARQRRGLALASPTAGPTCFSRGMEPNAARAVPATSPHTLPQTEVSRPAFPLQNNNAIRRAVTMRKRFRKTAGAETIRSLCKGSQGKQILQSRLLPPNPEIFSIFHSLCGNYSFASRQSFHDKFGRGYAPSLMS